MWIPFPVSLPLAIGSLIAAALRPSGRTLVAGAVSTALVPLLFVLPWALASLAD